MTTASEIERQKFLNKLHQLVDYLPQGQEHPITANDLSKHIGVDKRTLSAYVSYLIKREGVPIGSSRRRPTGYYLIMNEWDRQNTITPLEAQASEELKRANSLRRINLDTWREEFEKSQGSQNQ